MMQNCPTQVIPQGAVLLYHLWWEWRIDLLHRKHVLYHYTFLHWEREQVEMRMQTTATKGTVILAFLKLGNQKIS